MKTIMKQQIGTGEATRHKTIMTDGLSTSPLSTARGQSSGFSNSTKHTCDSSNSIFGSSDTNGSSPYSRVSSGTGRCCSRVCVVCGQSTAKASVFRLSCQHIMCQSCYMNMDIVECPNCYSTVSDVIRFKFNAPGITTTNSPCPTTSAACKGNIENDTASDEEITYLEMNNVTSHLPLNKASGNTGRLFPTVSQAHEVTSSLANTACRKISLPIHLAQACNNEITNGPLKCCPVSKRNEDTPPVACSSSSEPTSCSDSDSDDYEDYMGPCSASNSSKYIDVKREHSRATPGSQQTYQNVAIFTERHLNPCSMSGPSAISCLSQESGLPCCKIQTTTKNSSFNNSWTEEVYQNNIPTINSPTSPLYINMDTDTFHAPPPPCDANSSYVNDAASTSSGNSGNHDNDSERELDSIYTYMDGSNSNTRWERRALSAATKLFGDSSSNSSSPVLPHRNRASSDISNLSSAFAGLEARQKQQLQVSSSDPRGLCEGQVRSGRNTSLLGKHVASNDCHSSAGSSCTTSLRTSPTQVQNCTPTPDICGSRSRSNSNCKPSEVCHSHDGQTIKYFCFTCSTVLCTMCTVLDDNHARPGHRIFPLSDAEPRCRDQLAELERKLQAEVVLANSTHDKFKRRQRKELASYERAVEAVNERTAALMNMLSEWQAETLATLKVQHITATQSLQTATDQAGKHAHTVSSLVNVIKRSGQSSAAWCLSEMGVSARDTLASKLTYPSVSLCKVSMTTLIQPHMFGSVEENSDSCCQSHYANITNV